MAKRVKKAIKKASGKGSNKNRLNINTIIIVVALIVSVIAMATVFRDEIGIAISNFGLEEENNGTNTQSTLGGHSSYNLPVELGDIGLTINFIDVGQGDSILATLPDGKRLIVDGGSSGGIRTKDYLDYLETFNIDTFDYMIITHPDSDHINLLDDVLDNYHISHIYYNDYNHDTVAFRVLEEKIQKENALLTLFDEDGDIYYIEGDDYLVKIYSPGYDRFDDNNSMSPIISIKYAGRNILLTGDATSETESWFMDVAGDDYDCDILKVAHHGSDTSSSLEFLEFIQTEYAIISVAETSSHKHPSSLVMNRLFNLGIVTYRTNRHGNIVLYMDTKGEFAFGVDNEVIVDNNRYLINDRLIYTSAP